MRRYRRDAGLSLRLALSLVGLLLLYVPLLLWPVGAVLFAVIALGRALFARRDLSELADAPAELRLLVDRLCGLSGVSPPRVAVLETDLPNAYTLGNPLSGCTIVVSRGLLRELNLDELEAVVAHELAHVAHRDAFVMVIVSFPAGMFRGLALALTRTRLIPLAFAAWVAATVAALPLMAFSRYRELVADRGAALLTGRPEALMSALQKLSAGVAQIPGEDLRAAAGLNPFFVIPTPAPSTGLEPDPFVLFPTHPTLAQRLERLASSMQTGAPIVVEAPRRPANPRAGLGFRLALVTWPLGWGIPYVLGDGFYVASLLGMATWVAAFVCTVQALARAQRGAAGGRVAAASMLVLAAPLVFTVVGGAVLAL